MENARSMNYIVGSMFGENQRFFTNEPMILDKKPDMKECSRMGIRPTKGGNMILTGIHFEFPDDSRVQCVSPRIFSVPPRVSADTGRPRGYVLDIGRVWGGS